MKRPEPLLRRLLFPGGGWAALAVFAAVASLWTVFSNGWEDAPAARAAYAFSAYALVVAICRAVPAARRAKTAVYGLPPVRRWRADAALRALVSLRAGLCVNLCFAACKLYAGIRFRSPWFGAAAVYYTVLSTMRFAVLRGVRNAPPVCRSCPADARAACLPALRCADVCPESGHDGHSRTNGLAEPRIPLSRHADLCLSRIYVLLLRQRSSQRGESAPHA